VLLNPADKLYFCASITHKEYYTKVLLLCKAKIIEISPFTKFMVSFESSIMKLATLLYSKKIVSLSLSKSVISFDNRLEAVRLSGQG